jgi:hypothetical protein
MRGGKPGIRMPVGPAAAEGREAGKCILPADAIEKIENASW